MSNETHESIGAALGKCAALIATWLGTVTLSQVQVSVSIFSGLLVALYTCVKLYKELKGKP